MQDLELQRCQVFLLSYSSESKSCRVMEILYDYSSIFQGSRSESELADTQTNTFMLLNTKCKTYGISFPVFLPPLSPFKNCGRLGERVVLGSVSWLISHLVFMIFQILCPIF